MTTDNTVRADELAQGQTIATPYSGTHETITDLWISHGYVNVRTYGAGLESAYQWPGDEPITVVAEIADLRAERDKLRRDGLDALVVIAAVRTQLRDAVEWAEDRLSSDFNRQLVAEQLLRVTRRAADDLS
jgi:hypothetical protein